MKLKQFIVEVARKVGIDIIGFTDCNILDNIEDYLLERIEDNRITEFEERDIKKRIDPKKVFPDCNSIIVLGISYNVDFNEYPSYKLKGKISKSSWGEDYHRVVKDKMDKLVYEIEKVVDFKYLSFVDTGPLVDRELAMKAGVGWYGKNCSIINDEYGSFIFIGYILTDLEIESDNSIQSKCGNCERCLKACPTGALEGAYKFNPKKCISYLTQTKERIPYELREKMGISIYGCDVCQLACPKNSEAIKSKSKEFIPKVTKGFVDIEEMLEMSNSEFKEKYGSMAGSWRGKNVLKRNCLIALGNMKNKHNIPLLKKVLLDSSPMVREYAAWAILKTDYNIGVKAVAEVIKVEKDIDVKEEMQRLLKYFHKKIFNVS
ncbi:tRNA epoxyqueuosine(34) reductase QueG [Anaerosalibacter sp. Marseille-P3206]|uniref:tRNA epoxyqueuosine(34) reductase QueG n=1 Tax=Anaerosalibacter sp. Marseille-P3206 TaxID=1871005 RepID=UPI0009879F98|nr:tRNA epoxyqueuosine(34) reductase QueG [Anaerosalibacter sp. Marseille-P3206]